MLTEQERAFLDAMAKAPIPTDVQGLRAAMDTFAPLINSNPPEIGALHPVVVYLHGGGWIGGSPKTHRKLGMQFADAGYLTINVDYRLAPEHPFPAGLEDCIFAVKWAGQNAKRWNGYAARLAVGGDSAGGNLTAASLTALAAENYAGPKPKA